MPAIAVVAVLITSAGTFVRGGSNMLKLNAERVCLRAGHKFEITQTARINRLGKWQCVAPAGFAPDPSKLPANTQGVGGVR